MEWSGRKNMVNKNIVKCNKLFSPLEFPKLFLMVKQKFLTKVQKPFNGAKMAF